MNITCQLEPLPSIEVARVHPDAARCGEQADYYFARQADAGDYVPYRTHPVCIEHQAALVAAARPTDVLTPPVLKG